ncbi:MAG: hybrid sensor histidine kinase/response regulator, partial [Desulfobacterales bacterium]|nr:hybrid sensor histidine kinase/response regulator [Desulfobacterales bacterium]
NIIINDDGRGIDAGQIVEKAVGKKLVDRTHANRMKEKEKLNLIFLPGFSTAENITDISGRGVGMDVVKTGVEKLGGHLDVATEIGKGTTVQLTIPLTLAIIPSLIVGAGNLRFAIPQVNVKELIRIPAGDISRKIEKIGGSDVVRARGGLLPLLRLADVLSLNSSYTHPRTGEVNNDRRLDFAGRRRNAPDSFQTGEEDAAPAGPPDNRRRDADRRVNWRNDINVVVLWVGANVFGLCVEELFDHEEIVVKPLSKHIKDCKCFSGATIMGDGRVAMILDAAGIASHSRLRFGEINDEEDRRRAEERRGSRKKELKSILLFNCAPDERFAMPLSGVSRLELIAPRTIERIGDQEFIAYRGEGLPLIRLEKFLPVRPLPEKPGELYVIIPKTTRASMGILASRIVDAIDAEVFIRKNAGPVSGLLESAIVEDRLMFFLDADGLLKLIEERQSLYTRPEAMGNR